MICTSTTQLKRAVFALAAAVWLMAPAAADDPSHNAFTYQGELRENGEPVSSAVNLKFRLYDAAVGGTQVGPELQANGFDAFDDQGRFTIDLNLGKSIFDGTPLWLEIQVNATTLSPRQPIMPTPYSIRALNVATVGSDALAGSYNNALEFSNSNNVFSGTFSGSGAALTNLNASSINSGTIGSSLLAGTYSSAVTFNHANNAFAGTFSGNGSLLTNLNASNLAFGTVPDARLSSNVAFLNAGPVFGGYIGLGSGFGPSAPLHIVQAADTAPNFMVDNHIAIRPASDNEDAAIGLYTTRTATPRAWSVRAGSGAGNTNFRIYDATAGADRLNITSTGRVGIGTTDPDARLHVNSGGIASAARFDSSHSSGTFLTLHNSSVGGRHWHMVSTGLSSAEGTGRLAFREGTSGTTAQSVMMLERLTDTNRLALSDTAGNFKVFLVAEPDDATFALTSSDHVARFVAMAQADNSGLMTLSGQNGSVNVLATRVQGHPNHGAVAVVDSANVARASMLISDDGFGAVQAEIKNFRVAHPLRPGHDIVYACIEGPEAAMYVRGTATLVNGFAHIELPEHFTALAVEDGMTVQITPRSAESRGLAAVERATTHIVVAELMNGTGSYEFDWEVKAVRKGFENYRPVRSSDEDRISLHTLDHADPISGAIQ